jgi:hypothetical protein
MLINMKQCIEAVVEGKVESMFKDLLRCLAITLVACLEFGPSTMLFSSNIAIVAAAVCRRKQ